MLRPRVLAPALVLPLVLALAGASPVAAQEAAPVAFAWLTGGGPGHPLGGPTALAVDPEGDLWVVDGGNGRFQLFAPDGTFREAWGTPGTAEGQFDFVSGFTGLGSGGVAFAAAGTIYVADTGNHRVQKIDPDRRFVASWGGEGSGDGQFHDPRGIAVGRDGTVYVADGRRDDIQAFDPDGAFLFAFGNVYRPTSLAAAPDGTLLVADSGNSRVQRFALDGTFLASFGAGEGELFHPLGVAADAQGRVYVTEGHRVQVFDGEGRFLAAWGEFGLDAGQFQIAFGIAVDGAGQAYVSEVFGNRVQAFRLLPPLAPDSTPAP